MGTRAASPTVVAPSRMTAAARRDQLMDVAGAILLESGFDAVTMESVANAAGASKTLGYVYFDNVDDLLWSLYDRELAALYERVRAATQSASGFDGQVSAAVHAYFDSVAARGALLATLQAVIESTRLARAASQHRSGFIDHLASLVDAELSVGRRRAGGLAAVMARVADSYVRLWATGAVSRRDAERSAVAFALAGVRAAAR